MQVVGPDGVAVRHLEVSQVLVEYRSEGMMRHDSACHECVEGLLGAPVECRAQQIDDQLPAVRSEPSRVPPWQPAQESAPDFGVCAVTREG